MGDTNQDAWGLQRQSLVLMHPVGLSEVPAVPSRVGGSIADCGGELTGPVATNNL